LPSPPALDPATEGRLRRGALVGRPEEVAKQMVDIRQRAGVPLHFIARCYFAGMPLEQQMETMQRVADEVIPLLP
ncbi:MAG: hypothetical protein M3N51_08785, partial [Actinomycetota bacterium]|nr:hypothetical protein [Actinomycetota bacterium]